MDGGVSLFSFANFLELEWQLNTSGVKIYIINDHETKASEKGQIVADDSWVVIPSHLLISGQKEPNEYQDGIFTKAKGVVKQIFVTSSFFLRSAFIQLRP